jgi:zinc transport system ATP-binding protein
LVLAVLGELSSTGSISFYPEKPKLGFVPQRLDFDRHLPITVNEFMSLGRTRWPMWLRIPAKIREENSKFLELVKASKLAERPLGSLSGGETQRVFLARELMRSPDILILDEPATGVDVYGEQLLCEILESFKKNFTIIMVSHDLATAKAHGDWIICLNRTVIAEGPPGEIFRPAVLSRAFGLHQSLLFGGEGEESEAGNAAESESEGESEERSSGKAPERKDAPCGCGHAHGSAAALLPEEGMAGGGEAGSDGDAGSLESSPESEEASSSLSGSAPSGRSL